MQRHLTRLLSSALLLATACASSSKTDATPTASSAAGLTATPDGWTFRTEDFTLEPGQEKYLCYAVTTKEKVVVDRFTSSAHPTIHHLLFSEATAKETEGMSECPVIFKATWAPLFVATTADTDVKLPDGAAKTVDDGGQMVLQLHLVNTSSDKATDFGEIHMRRSTLTNPEPVSVFAFGTTDIHVPAKQITTLDATCTMKQDVRLFAMLPHMHFLGKKLELLVGPDENRLKSVFVRDPYDFNDQYIEPLELDIPSGSVTRTRCTYDNTRDTEAAFGESSFDEMCFAVGLAVGGSGKIGGCMQAPPASDAGVPRAADAGVCGEVETPTGVGRKCTQAGNECPGSMMCSAGQGGTDASAGGICIQLGCTATSDCGTGGTCCTPAQGGGLVNICIPEACRPATCAPVK
jgi:hypothetical protein